MSDEQTPSSKGSFRRLKYAIAVLCIPLLLRIPFVSNLIKDVSLLAVNDLSDYHITIDDMSIRPVLFGVKLKGVEVQDKQQTLVRLPEAFIGFKIPSEGTFIRTIVLILLL